uniref:hypothetical protein n=1 Tax=Actinomadura sp. CA-154981 TaxID=3240037 RepID=UPI003F491AE0
MNRPPEAAEIFKIKPLDATARPLKPQTRVTAMPADMLAECALDRADGPQAEAPHPAAAHRADG